MRIRRALTSDIPAMRAVACTTGSAGQWSAEVYDRIFSPDALPRLILVIDGAAAPNPAEGTRRARPVLLGFIVVLCAGVEWELENLVVAEGLRRHGLGTRLLRSLLVQARRAHAVSIFLEVRESNHPARQLYEKAGFVSAGRRSAYYADPPEDAIVYRFQFPARQ